MKRIVLTEEINPSTADLDALDTHELLHRINDEDRKAVWAVERELDVIATAVDSIAQRLAAGGRLHYFGAGTSGRVAVTDAAEIPPTFSSDLIVAHIAGGAQAMTKAAEGAEDDEAAGRAEVTKANIGARDAVIGLSASGSAPYVLGAMHAAREAGALTIGISNAQSTPLGECVQISISLLTGAEVIAGSTRMKAASAQKMALAALSTAVMVKLGRVHGNLMVGLAASNAKLKARAVRMTMLLGEAGESAAQAALDTCGYKVGVATLMLRAGCDAATAQELLDRSGGNLRRALSGRGRDPGATA